MHIFTYVYSALYSRYAYIYICIQQTPDITIRGVSSTAILYEKYIVMADIFYHITKTCLYKVDPLKPHFYIVKLGFTGEHINFLISAQNIDCENSLKPPRRGGSNEYPQSMF